MSTWSSTLLVPCGRCQRREPGEIPPTCTTRTMLRDMYTVQCKCRRLAEFAWAPHLPLWVVFKFAKLKIVTSIKFLQFLRNANGIKITHPVEHADLGQSEGPLPSVDFCIILWIQEQPRTRTWLSMGWACHKYNTTKDLPQWRLQRSVLAGLAQISKTHWRWKSVQRTLSFYSCRIWKQPKCKILQTLQPPSGLIIT